MEFVVAKVYTSRVEADIAKSSLDVEGIDAILQGDDAGGTMPHLSFSNGVKLLVLRKDLSRAHEILD